MTDSMLDLVIRPMEDGGVELCQFGGRLDDDPDKIHLHRVQVALLAECAGLIPAPAPGLLDRLTARHVARIHALRDRLHNLYDLYNDEIIDRCGSGIEISLHLEAIRDLVYEMIEDIGTAPPAEPVTKKNETSAVISVTPAKRGISKHCSPAERQRAHRAKQGELHLLVVQTYRT